MIHLFSKIIIDQWAYFCFSVNDMEPKEEEEVDLMFLLCFLFCGVYLKSLDTVQYFLFYIFFID